MRCRILSTLLAIGLAGPTAAPSLAAEATTPVGAFHSGIYQNLFSERLGKSDEEVQAKLEAAWAQLFHGDPATQRVYYPVDPDLGYVLDVGNGDVRSEGMSYGMMIAVQMNRKEEFDRIWKWARTYMYHSDGARRGYFAWHCTRDGVQLDANSASDGEEWFAMALFFAAGRWGNGEGIYDYAGEARALLHTMLHKAEEGQGIVTNMFHPDQRQVVFVPEAGQASSFTDPSYHVPHYYELWSRWAVEDQAFWGEAAAASRLFFRAAAHPSTGLMPDYASFDGAPVDPWGGGHDAFRFDAWRVAMNVAVDWAWFAADDWEVEESDRLLGFFRSQGIDSYGNQFTLDGRPLSNTHSLGLVSMNAVAALAATSDQSRAFVEALWNATPPTGQWRYYDGMLYMLALLDVSGQFRIYPPPPAP